MPSRASSLAAAARDGYVAQVSKFSCRLFASLTPRGALLFMSSLDGDDVVHDVVLFYAYTDIDDPERVAETLKRFCSTSNVLGRILIAREGVNGTVCASRATRELEKFKALLAECVPGARSMPYKRSEAIGQVFYDVRVEVVRELVGWGQSDVKHERRDKVIHLAPREFHEALKARFARGEDVKLLDLRNENESLVGKFLNAETPRARNMGELGRFLDDEARDASGREVFMYCTGGIRCEKAALYLEKKQPDVRAVYQLEGGIHEYLQEFGADDECLYLGANFTFDKRGVSARGKMETSEVWRCQKCKHGEPTIVSCGVCVVCRFSLVLCRTCFNEPSSRGEWTCSHHAHLEGVYSFYAIPNLTNHDLERRIATMKALESEFFAQDPAKTSNKRRTLRKCYSRMANELARRNAGGEADVRVKSYCRNSGRELCACEKNCMGFWGPGHVKDRCANAAVSALEGDDNS